MTGTQGSATRDGRRIAFKRHLRAETVPGEAVYLVSERGVQALHGRYLEILAPLLDGTRDLNAILRDAWPSVPPAEAGRAIGDLARAGVIGYRPGGAAAGTPAVDHSAEAYWDLAGLDGDAVARQLTDTPIALVTLGGTDEAAARAACHASGLTLVPGGGRGTPAADAAFSLVLCDDYLDPELRAVDALHRTAGRSWLLARPTGVEPYVGPVFRPGEGPCWLCLAHRLRENRSAELVVQHGLGGDGPLAHPPASLAAGSALGLGAAVLEATKWVAGFRHGGQSAIQTTDTLTMSTARHPVQRRPQCPACGDPALTARRTRRPVALASRPKAPGGGGNHRALSADAMRKRFAHLVSPVTGVVSELTSDDRLPENLHSCLSGRNLAMPGRSLGELRGNLRSLCGGKGVTRTEAEVGALCEAVERHSATRQGDEAVVRDTLSGLGTAAAVHPNAVQLFHERQFRDRERWNTSGSPLHRVPAPFDPERPVDWTPVWSLTHGRHRLLPTSLLYFSPARDGSGPWADSNGCAAGSSPEDAVVQGFLELVERDAAAQWWYNRTRHPAVCLDAFSPGAPWLPATRESYAALGRDLWVLDITSDLGVPVMAAVSRRRGEGCEDVLLGLGAHFDPVLALRRAVTEMSQLLPHVLLTHRPDGQRRSADQVLDRWWTRATVRKEPYLLPDDAEPPRTPERYAYVPRSDLREDVDAAEELARGIGSELLVLDQTRPDTELPVVRVLVPGLRHFWPRFGPGRLYTVPVELGRLSRPTPYERLNPWPLFL